MRKSISVCEAKSPVAKQIDLADKLVKELNSKAGNKLRLIRADIEMGDQDESKIGAGLDAFNQAMDKAIIALMKI